VNPDAATLLIVEDSPVQSKIIRKQFEVLTELPLLSAYSLADAQLLMESRGNDLFATVADLNLPDAPNGEIVDLCRRFHIPVIVLTATFDETLRRRFLEKQVSDYFLKGSIDDMNPLVDSVQRLYANGRVQALVVDDSPTQRAIVCRLLAIQRIRALEAADGEQALEVLRNTPDVRLIITDFQMPVMDGIELARRVRATHKMHKLAIIGLSAAGSGHLTARFLKNGANDFLTKPFESEEFHWRVNQTLSVLDALDELRKYRGQQT